MVRFTEHPRKPDSVFLLYGTRQVLALIDEANLVKLGSNEWKSGNYTWVRWVVSLVWSINFQRNPVMPALSQWPGPALLYCIDQTSPLSSQPLPVAHPLFSPFLFPPTICYFSVPENGATFYKNSLFLLFLLFFHSRSFRHNGHITATIKSFPFIQRSFRSIYKPTCAD